MFLHFEFWNIDSSATLYSITRSILADDRFQVRNMEIHVHALKDCVIFFQISQPNIQSCNDCEETFTHMRHLRRHITTAHNKNPDYVCKLCSQVFDSSKTLRSHFYQIHNVQDDVMETLSVSSDDGTKVAYLETEDTSDSLSFNSDSALHNGLESVDSNEQNSTSNGLELDQNHLGIVPKIEGNVAMVTTPEQVTVN